MALQDDTWMSNIRLQVGIMLDNKMSTFGASYLANVNLQHGTPDNIIGKFTNDGMYSASSAYKAQLEGITSTTMRTMVRKLWGP